MTKQQRFSDVGLARVFSLNSNIIITIASFAMLFIVLNPFRLYSQITLSATSLDYGSVLVGTTAPDKIYTVTGTGIIDPSILVGVSGSFTIADNAAGPFGASVTLPNTGGDVWVRYTASASGIVSGTITHTADAFSETVALLGEGIIIPPPVLEPPTISKFAPNRGSVGTTIVISGTNFVNVVAVRIGEVSVAFIVNSPSEISLVIPSTGVASGNVVVQTSAGIASIEGFSYIPPPPFIISFSPESGTPGTQVTIIGANFINVRSVLFGSTEVPFTVVNANQITVTITNNPIGGNISIITGTGIATSETAFLFNTPPPSVTGFSPTTGIAGTNIVISGSNFFNAISVLIGETPIPFIIASDTQISAQIPASGISTITGLVTVTGPGGRGISTQLFTFIPPPTISSFNFATARGVTQLTINGSNFTNIIRVNIGTVSYPFMVISSNRILVTIPPSSTPNGVISVTGSTGTGIAGSEQQFPSINRVSPPSGGAGTIVSILGNNLGSATEVKIGTTVVPFTLVSIAQLNVMIPRNGPSGQITIITNFGITVTTATFSFIPPTPRILSFTPIVGGTGTIVTLTGENFTDVSGLRLGTTPVQFSYFNSRVLNTIPFGFVSTTATFSITTPAGVGTATESFRFIASPSIDSFSPRSVKIGENTSLTVVGTNFESVIGASIGGVSVPYTVNSPTQLTMEIPSRALTNATIRIATLYGAGISPEQLTVVAPPRILDIMPMQATVGSVVTITGENFINVESVVIGTVSMPFRVVSPGQIRITLLANRDVSASILVTTAFGTALSPQRFTYQPTTSIRVRQSNISSMLGLQVFPNPVQERTTITFSLDYSQAIDIKLYDMTGRIAASITQATYAQGTHSIPLPVGILAQGLYTLVLTTKTGFATHPISILR